jgi:hypothetical protein
MEGKHELKRLGVIGEEAPLNRSPEIQPLQPKYVQGRNFRW